MRLDDVHLQRILELIGAFPLNFIENCQKRTEFFDKQGDIQLPISE